MSACGKRYRRSHTISRLRFRRLLTLSAEELTRHIERLERDLDDLSGGTDACEDTIDT